MKRNPLHASMVCVALAAAAVLAIAQPASAKHGGRINVTGYAGVDVWVDGGDVFADYRDVTVWLRAERDCYTSLFLVDTDGYIHVLNPGRRFDDGWVNGGATYCYRACDLGLDRLHGRGIAYVFAIGSPVAFDYSYYGDGVFVGGFGYRVTGDPFDACRSFYVSLLPAACRWDYVGVGYARFYVREWARYPSYLCGGPGFHVHAGGACRLCDHVYVSYRAHAAAPYEAIRPVPRFKNEYQSDRHPADRQLTGRVQAGRASNAVVHRDVKYKDSRSPARVVSTSRARASESDTRSTGIRAGGAMSRPTMAATRQPSVSASRKPVAAKVAKSPSQEKGAKKKVRQAQ